MGNKGSVDTWYQNIVTDIVGQTFSYLRGTRPTLEVVIPIADRKPAMSRVLSELAEQKLRISELLGIDISSLIMTLVDMWLPDQWTFDDAELRQMLGAGEDDEDILEKARKLVQEGVTYTSDDLRVDMGDDYDTVENIRQGIADGFRFTEKDLRNWTRGAIRVDSYKTLIPYALG